MGMFKDKLGFDAIRKPGYNGKRYKKVKSFKSQKEAMDFADEIEYICPSKRYPPLVDIIPIWGKRKKYNVCVPEEVNISEIKKNLGGKESYG